MSGRRPMQSVTPEWIADLHNHVRADFDKGHLYWTTPGRGKNLYKPIGCIDSNGYVKVQINKVSTYTHIVIYYLFYGVWPTSLIDHLDRNPANNKPDNLELSNHSKNAMNGDEFITNTTGVRGVSWCSASGKYKVTKQGRHLGYFTNLATAAVAYAHG